MKRKSYTLFIAASDSGQVRRVRVPLYLVQLLLLFSLVGGVTVVAALGSYSRMLWKVTNYNALRREQSNLKKQYMDLQAQVTTKSQQVKSLESLASTVEIVNGFAPVGLRAITSGNTDDEAYDADYQSARAELDYLATNSRIVPTAMVHARSVPMPLFPSFTGMPTLWPVVGEITGYFGKRQDPFEDEGVSERHTGLDIASHLGDPIRATADGVVIFRDKYSAYGRLVIIDHGDGVATWYAHLKGFNTVLGAQVKRGDIIGYEGASGHATGPHLHYEIRRNNVALDPWPYLRNIEASPVVGD